MSRYLVTRLSPRVPSVFRHFVAGLATNTGSGDHIESLVKGKKVVVFMKGNPEAPRCGFSNGVMQILEFHGVKNFETHDVLEDEELRQGVKDYSNWPTIPQVYINGEFVGGMDIFLDMHKNGELVEELQKVGIRSALLDNDTSPDRQG